MTLHRRLTAIEAAAPRARADTDWLRLKTDAELLDLERITTRYHDLATRRRGRATRGDDDEMRDLARLSSDLRRRAEERISDSKGRP